MALAWEAMSTGFDVEKIHRTNSWTHVKKFHKNCLAQFYQTKSICDH